MVFFRVAFPIATAVFLLEFGFGLLCKFSRSFRRRGWVRALLVASAVSYRQNVTTQKGLTQTIDLCVLWGLLGASITGFALFLAILTS